MAELAGCVVPRASGGFVCATETGFKTISADGTIGTLCECEADRPGNRSS